MRSLLGRHVAECERNGCKDTSVPVAGQFCRDQPNLATESRPTAVVACFGIVGLRALSQAVSYVGAAVESACQMDYARPACIATGRI